jgi:hypothetical protein
MVGGLTTHWCVLSNPTIPASDSWISWNKSNLYINTVFELIKYALQSHGALVVESFQVFPEFVDISDQKEFHGDWKDKDKYTPEQMLNTNNTLLVGDASLTGSSDKMGGIALVVQNSSDDTPFVIIGYDLLRSVGVNKLLAVAEGLNFETGAANISGDPSALPVHSASPRAPNTHSGRSPLGFQQDHP